MRIERLAQLALITGCALAAVQCGGEIACDGGDDAQAVVDGSTDSDGGVADSADDSETAALDAPLDAPADASSCPARVPTGTLSTAYQIDSAHTGAQPFDTIAAPLCRRWQRDFITYSSSSPSLVPLILPGRVIAVDRGDVYALSPDDGSTLWGPSPMNAVAIASDGKSLFVESGSGYVAALDPVTGHLQWQVPRVFDQSHIGPMSVGGGVVVISLLDGAYALDALDGHLVWEMSKLPMTCAPNTVLSGVAYVACPDEVVAAIDAATGQVDWQHAFANDPLVVSYDLPPVSTSSRLLVPDFGGQHLLTIDGTSGDIAQTSIRARFGPAVSGGSLFVVTFAALKAWSADLAQMFWSFQGDGTLYGAPIVVGDRVVIGSAHHLYLLDAATGALASQDSLPGQVAGIAEADGVLVVATSDGLVAY